MFSKELSSGIVALLCLVLLTELTCTVYMYMYICNKHLCICTSSHREHYT